VVIMHKMNKSHFRCLMGLGGMPANLKEEERLRGLVCCELNSY